jgi:VanZ family protein
VSERRATGLSERRLWILVAVAVAAIFLSLYPLQFALNWLRERNLLRLTIGALFALVAAGAVAWLARHRAGLREWLVLVLAAVVYAAFATSLDVPQERLHLVQYGGLALLLEAAFAERERSAGRGPAGRRSVFRALATASAIGLADEIVQGALPNRQYDTRDVIFNALSAGLALLTTAALRVAARRPAA